MQLIKESDVSFIDRYEEGLTNEQRDQRLKEGLLSDLFITSTKNI